MPKAKQLTIACKNRPGTLAHLARVLGDAKVNIAAMNCFTSGAQGTVQIIVDNARKAKKALRAARFSCTEADVLHAQLPNVPGALGRFAGKLAAKGINVASGYQTSTKGARKAAVVFTVSHLRKAARIR